MRFIGHRCTGYKWLSKLSVCQKSHAAWRLIITSERRYMNIIVFKLTWSQDSHGSANHVSILRAAESASCWTHVSPHSSQPSITPTHPIWQSIYAAEISHLPLHVSAELPCSRINAWAVAPPPVGSTGGLRLFARLSLQIHAQNVGA